MLDLRLVQLKHFLLVVENNGFRTAARRAFKSQPALSQSIRQLEQRLGQPLFERASRTTLTEFGRFCLPIVREMVANIERSMDSMRHVAQASGGRISIAILPSIATQWLPLLMRQFSERHPEVQVTILAEDSNQVHRLISEGQVDFGVSSLSSPDPNIVFEPLLEDRFGLLCRKDHPFAAANASIPWERLRGEAILGNVMHRLLVDTRVAVYVSQPTIHVSNLPTLLSLVREGLGVTPLPALACPASASDLAFVPLIRPVCTRTIGLMRLVGRSLLPAANVFAMLLRERSEQPINSPRRNRSSKTSDRARSQRSRSTR